MVVPAIGIGEVPNGGVCPTLLFIYLPYGSDVFIDTAPSCSFGWYCRGSDDVWLGCCKDIKSFHIGLVDGFLGGGGGPCCCIGTAGGGGPPCGNEAVRTGTVIGAPE